MSSDCFDLFQFFRKKMWREGPWFRSAGFPRWAALFWEIQAEVWTVRVAGPTRRPVC